MKTHSAISNERWLLARLIRYEKRWPLQLAGLVTVKLLLPFLSALLPAAAVAALTHGGGMGRYLAAIGGLMALYAAMTFLRDWLENLNLILRDNFRKEVCIAGVMEKALTMDYGRLESPEGQKSLADARNMAANSETGVNRMLCVVEPWLRSLLGILLYGGMAAALDWRILLVLAGMAAASYAADALLQQYERMTRKEQTRYARELDYFKTQADDLANGKDVRLYRMEDWFMACLRAVFQGRWKWMRGLVRRQMVGKLSDLGFLALRDIVAYSTLVAAFLSGRMDAAEFTLSLGVLAALTSTLNEFVHQQDDLLFFNIGFDHYRNFMEDDFGPSKGGNAGAASARRPPRIELRNVTFTYPEAKAPAIDRLSLTLEPGEKVALVGLNGAGKTTLVKLLNGLYRPSHGQILIDGLPAEQFGPKEFFRLVGTVFQDVNLLPFTIGENLAGRESYDPAPVWESLDKAGLRQTVGALPKGLDTHLTQQIEPDGVELSGGQRQRLAFARALYKDAPLLILDEPTAALDPLAEADLYRKFAGETAGKTSVFISHRLGSTSFCDRVVYLEGGRITEMGTHQELLALGGAYAQLFRVQSSWYTSEKEGAYHGQS